MLVKLPKLERLIKFNKDNPESPSNFIHVKNGIAFSTNGSISLFVNIKDYIKNECSIVDERDFERLENFVSFLDNKSFSTSFWKELTKDQFVSVVNDRIQIQNPTYTKELSEEEFLDMDQIALNKIIKIYLGLSNRKGTMLEMNSQKASDLLKILTIFSAEMKEDSIVLKYDSGHDVAYFQGKHKRYIFGLFQSDISEIESMFAFDSFNDLKERFI